MLLARFAGAVNSLVKMQAEPTRPISDSTRTTQQCIHKVVGQHALACKSLLCCLKYLCRRKQNAAASTGRARPRWRQAWSGQGACCILCLAAIFLAMAAGA